MGMMGIVDEPADRLQRIGNIKMGRKGKAMKKRGSEETYRLPEKFDHFEITTMERDEHDDWKPDVDLIELLGKDPKEIPVMVPFDHIMDIFPHELAWWKSSRRMCHGNGVVGLRYDEKTDTEQEMKCRCELFTGAGGTKRVCKKNGILNVIITASGRIGGVYQLRTTSGATISNIKASVKLIQSFTGGPVAGIPLMLTIQQQWAYPIVKGVKQKTKIFVAGLDFRADTKLDKSPAEQLLESAGVQVQARLSVSKDVRQIERYAGGINRNTPDDDLDMDQEFGEGAGPQGVEGDISEKTDDKSAALKKRLAEAPDADYDEPPVTEPAEPTPAEIRENLRTEIETLLENEALPHEIVKKTTKWLEKNRQAKSLEATKAALIEEIEKAKGQPKEEPKEKSEDGIKKDLRAEIATLMKDDSLPKAMANRTAAWLEKEDRTIKNLEDGRDRILEMIAKVKGETGDLLPGEDQGAKPSTKKSDEANRDKPTLAELGNRVIEMLGEAKEDALITEEEGVDVFNQVDALNTAEEIKAVHVEWQETIEDRRKVREAEKDQDQS